MSSESTVFTVRRGAPITADLVAESYDQSLNLAAILVTMRLKKATPSRQPPLKAVTPVAQFAVTYHAPSETDPLPFWRGVIAASVAAQIDSGFYVADAEVVFEDGFVLVTEPVVINSAPSVTPL